MYKIIWTPTAEKNLYLTLEYWINHNKSTEYSEKIIDQVDLVVKEIVKDPYFLANYITSINLYRKVFFKGKFAIYYEIVEKNIIIEYFRSTKQKPPN